MSRRGLTLVEMLVVLAILVAMAAIVVPLLGDSPVDAQSTVTKANLVEVRDAYVRLRVENPFRADGLPLMPDQIRVGDLFTQTTLLKAWDPLAKTGWHGPYLRSTGSTYTYPTSGTDARGFTAAHGTGAVPDLCTFDAFHHADGLGRPLVLNSATDGGTLIVWVQSAGPNGVLETPAGIPFPSDKGSDFRNGATTVHVDDLTLRVYP